MLLVLLLCVGVYGSLYPQSKTTADTTVYLPDVTISTDRPQLPSIGELRTIWPDSVLDIYSGRSFDALLSRETGAFIKSYGAGGIATVSLRGGNASQIAVLWNGVQLTNPMVGLQDLSLIPAHAIAEAKLTVGGSSSLSGSGGIAGTLQFNSMDLIPRSFGASAITTVGSYGLWDQSVKVNYGSGNFGGQTTYFHTFADNDFTFIASPGLPEQKMANAATSRIGILQDLYYKLSDRDIIKAHFWWQNFDREIPPTTVQNNSDATQADRSFRSVLEWQHRQDVLTYEFKGAFLRDEITYEDPQTLTYANSIATTAMVEAAVTWSIDPTQSILVGVNHYRLSGDIDAYDQTQIQNRTALFLRQYQQYEDWAIRTELRQEMVDGQFSPFIASIGFNYDPLSWVSIHGKVSRDYRLPGINDLYWRPGGDPNLKPERGWSEELGITLHRESGPHDIEIDFTGFNRNIKDWILWGISPGETFWSANNLTRVHSRGVDQRIRYNYTRKSLRLEATAGYYFVESTNEVALTNPMIPEGQQLAYVPRHKATTSFGTSYKGLTFHYYQTFAGEVLSERGDTLDRYTTGDIRLSYKLNLNTIALIPFFELLNTWDVDYRVIQYRPMPGRNYRIGIQFKFQ